VDKTVNLAFSRLGKAAKDSGQIAWGWIITIEKSRKIATGHTVIIKEQHKYLPSQCCIFE